MGDRWHTFTITDALGDKTEGVDYTVPSPGPERRWINPLPVVHSGENPSPTPVLATKDVFDGTSNHRTTYTLPSITIAASTITLSGTTDTIPATTSAITRIIYPQPADGCWDNAECWYKHTHHATSTIKTTGSVIKGNDDESSPSGPGWVHQWKFPLVMGILAFVLLLVGAFAGATALARWRGKKNRRRQAARDRQRKRMSSASAPQQRESRAVAVEAPIELGPVSGSQNNAWRKNGEARLGTIPEERWFGGHV
ncbi:MAG: hypothetical protein Q9174_003140 [Haloplaca sp. 1 TL-2023]